MLPHLACGDTRVNCYSPTNEERRQTRTTDRAGNPRKASTKKFQEEGKMVRQGCGGKEGHDDFVRDI
ncbi:hypothetical protein CH063_11258 [Colletotrichum higginsianum]|uniref:Uncharacterized protein n=1 Tax=Colletotrichum higginsianum (strain IMI 349063) TaxID=759273 RepID=H1VKM7_COLHI|nr:hypothetical protein CH063_11258 [Colletotrichum higginsianum]